jgi:hypothetical protein
MDVYNYASNPCIRESCSGFFRRISRTDPGYLYELATESPDELGPYCNVSRGYFTSSDEEDDGSSQRPETAGSRRLSSSPMSELPFSIVRDEREPMMHDQTAWTDMFIRKIPESREPRATGETHGPSADSGGGRGPGDIHILLAVLAQDRISVLILDRREE